MDQSIFLKWLGVAGIELKVNEHVLIIDPYFTRIPFFKIWFGKLKPDSKLIFEKIKYCDIVFITHSHIDHLMDVPDIIKYTGCKAYGSSNTCKLLSACGVPQELIFEIKVGDILNLGKFKLVILQANHRYIPGFSEGPLKYPLQPPFNARQYRMDTYFAFNILVNGVKFMTDPGINNLARNLKKTDVLFISASYIKEYYKLLLNKIHPKVLVPIHWDNFFSPLSKPVKPYFKTSSKTFPFLKRIDLNEFMKMIKKIDPKVEVIVPEIFHSYNIREIIKFI
ncbi:MAG: MBL fold metallo-hydrolase [Actinobacteria bacterium]|nr:MBL fold metallo-hydrolase [Actinomycetota bacterium]